MIKKERNFKDFWDKRLGRAVVRVALGESADAKVAKKALSSGKAGKITKNKKTNKTPSNGGASLKTKMKNNSRNIPGASEKSAKFNPASVDKGSVSKNTRKIKGKGRGSKTTKTNMTDKNDVGYNKGLNVASTKFMGG